MKYRCFVVPIDFIPRLKRASALDFAPRKIPRRAFAANALYREVIRLACGVGAHLGHVSNAPLAGPAAPPAVSIFPSVKHESEGAIQCPCGLNQDVGLPGSNRGVRALTVFE